MIGITARRTSSEGIIRLKGYEKFEPEPYMCSASVWTIGYGHAILDEAGHQLHGAAMHAEAFRLMPLVTEPGACQLLAQDLIPAEKCVDRLAQASSQHQFDAMVSLAFNIGTGQNGFPCSSVLRFHNAGAWVAAGDAFLLWDKETVDGNLVESAGLLNRRKQERAVYVS